MTTDRIQDPGAAGATPTTAGQPRLRRNLGSWQVLAVSLGVMGLSLSANLNPQGAEPSVGRAVPLAFLISAIAVLLLSYSFVRLSQHFNTAGSVFGFVGATLGARAGAVAGWCLLGGYLIFGAGSCYAAAVFFNSLLENLGVHNPAQWLPYVVTLVLLAIATAITVIPARRGTDLLLLFEAITVLLILIISIVVIIKISTGGGPQGQHFTLSVFTPAKGVSPSALFLGAVFGILAFVGFEGAATMGEEAREPRRTIPKAIFGTVLIGGTFYVFAAAVEVMGYGADKAGLARFEASGSLFGGLGSAYISSWVGDVVTIGTMVSALAGAIGCVVGSSRMIYAMSRSARGRGQALRKVSPRFGTPVGAITAAFVIMALSAVAFGWVISTSIFNAWDWTGEVGTLIVLVAYILATIGAARMLTMSTTVPKWQIAIPVVTVVVLGYTIFRNVIPYPTGAGFWLPIAAGIWVAIAVAAVAFLPGLVRRVGEDLAADQGLNVAPSRAADAEAG
ncbi:MAG TPA: APC family permease [Streptosporangiaceae bacterium]|jgi:amino acid transporter